MAVTDRACQVGDGEGEGSDYAMLAAAPADAFNHPGGRGQPISPAPNQPYAAVTDSGSTSRSRAGSSVLAPAPTRDPRTGDPVCQRPPVLRREPSEFNEVPPHATTS